MVHTLLLRAQQGLNAEAGWRKLYGLSPEKIHAAQSGCAIAAGAPTSLRGRAVQRIIR